MGRLTYETITRAKEDEKGASEKCGTGQAQGPRVGH